MTCPECKRASCPTRIYSDGDARADCLRVQLAAERERADQLVTRSELDRALAAHQREYERAEALEAELADVAQERNRAETIALALLNTLDAEHGPDDDGIDGDNCAVCALLKRAREWAK